MAKFKDTNGVEYELLVTVQTLQLAKKEREFDLAKLLYPGSREIERITEDPILLCDLCWLVAQHRKPADQRGKVEDFYAALAGDALDGAMEALLDAIADFYPRPEQRAFLRDLKKKAKGVTAKALQEAQASLAKIEVENLTKTVTEPNPTISSSTDSTPSSSLPTNPSEPSGSVSSSPESSGSPPETLTR